MMRDLTKRQENIYQEYLNLSVRIPEFKRIIKSKESVDEYIWEKITERGIWGLFISRQYGGSRLSWQDGVVGIGGLLTSYADTGLLSKIITQVCSIYLISQYGLASIKKQYLPRFMQGEISTLHISKNMDRDVHQAFSISKKLNHYSQKMNNEIHISVEKIKQEITFFISESQVFGMAMAANDRYGSVVPLKNELVMKTSGDIVLTDLINFKRLVYGILSKSIFHHMA